MLMICLVLLWHGEALIAVGMRDARLALQRGRPGDALELYLGIMAGGRDDAALWYGVARAQFALDRLVLSALACDAAIVRDGTHQGALVLRGRVRTAQHRFPEAIRDFESALILRPDDGYVCVLLARVLARQGRRSESYRYHERAAGTLPPDPERMLGAAWAAAAIERWGDAEIWCRRAGLAGAGKARLALLAPRIQLRLADAERRGGRVEAAKARLERLVREWPGTEEAASARLQIKALSRLPSLSDKGRMSGQN